MRQILFGTIAAGLVSASAFAGATVSPMGGAVGGSFNNGLLNGRGYDFAGAASAGPGAAFNLYNNIPATFGGFSDPGFFGPFGSVPGTFTFVDWTASQAQWGDDVHGLGPAPSLTRLWYGYFNGSTTAGTVTHVVKIYDMVPPSVVPPVTTLIQKGALLTSIIVPSLPTSTTQGFTVSVTFSAVALPNSAVWIKFEETGPAFPDTFWLSGGYAYGGFSNPGVLYSNKQYAPYPYNLWLPFPYFYFSGTGYVASNIAIGLGGFQVPGPAAAGLLGLGGLVVLRRRRVR